MPPIEPLPERLTTPRFELRRYVPSDAPGILRLLEANRGRLARDFPEIASGLTSLEAALDYVEDRSHRWEARTAFTYGIGPAGSGMPIGQLTVKSLIWNLPSAELSYFVDRSWLRRGVASEAIGAVLREAFERRAFTRIFVRVIATNSESLALARKVGFRREGLHRRAFRCGLGEIHDVHVLALTDHDYREGRAGSATP